MDFAFIGVILKFALPAMFAFLGFILARRIRGKRKRIVLRLLSSILAIAGIPLLIGAVILESTCTRRPQAIVSPDGKHIVFNDFVAQGALGDDYATVRVRRAWSPFSETVYSGLGSWDFKENRQTNPEVRWIDNSTLLIRYYDDRRGSEGRGGPALCENRSGRIRIQCVHISRQ
jgi:hypothetical protein